MRWVRLLTKVPVCLPNDAKELFEYYCKQKEIEVISLDCLKEYIKNPENPITFQILEEDLLFISKYDPSSDFVNICIKES